MNSARTASRECIWSRSKSTSWIDASPPAPTRANPAPHWPADKSHAQVPLLPPRELQHQDEQRLRLHVRSGLQRRSCQDARSHPQVHCDLIDAVAYNIICHQSTDSSDDHLCVASSGLLPPRKSSSSKFSFRACFSYSFLIILFHF